jgi:uncharacterized iron-regulated membrane protein
LHHVEQEDLEESDTAGSMSSGSATATFYKLVNLNHALHTGEILGLPSRIVASLASVIMPFQLLTGLLMWAKRRRTDATNAVETTKTDYATME